MRIRAFNFRMHEIGLSSVMAGPEHHVGLGLSVALL